MASLDVLYYVTRLDAALAAAGVRSAGIRRAALRDARRIIDAMAFRFALMDDRPLPEDLDYLRAIEAMKEPDRAAAVLARRAPLYARARRRRLTATWTIMLLVLLAVGGLAYLATSEKAETLAAFSFHPAVDVQYSNSTRFVVTSDMTRLHIDGSGFMLNGTADVFLVSPTNDSMLLASFEPHGDNYLRDNIESPMPGTWTLLVDFNQGHGAVDVTVDGIRPTR